MEIRIKKNMENEMETGGIQGFKELSLSYHNGYINNRVSPK